MNNLPFIRKIVSWLVYGSIVFFLILYFSRHASEIGQIFTNIRLKWLAPLIMLLILKTFFQALLWSILMRTMGCYLPLNYLLAVWHQSLIGKYVPGSIWMVVGRIYTLQQAGVSSKVAIYSTGLEQIVVLASGVLVVLLTPAIFELAHLPSSIGLVFAPFVMIILFPHLLGEIIWRIGIRRFDLRISSGPPPKAMALFFAGHTFCWFISGICVLIMVRLFGIEPLGINIVNAPSIAATGFVIGYLSLLTPSGIGVREGIFTFLLSLYIPLSTAILVAMSGRLWGLIAESIGIFGAFLYFCLNKKSVSFSKTAFLHKENS